MSHVFSSIGWAVDKSNITKSGATGTNHALGRLTALSDAAATDLSTVDKKEFQTVIAEVAKHIGTITPEEFFDGPSGVFVGPLVTALGGDASSIPDVPVVP